MIKMNRKIFTLLCVLNIGVCASVFGQSLIEEGGYYIFNGVSMEQEDEALLLNLFTNLNDHTLYKLEVNGHKYGDLSLDGVELLAANGGGDVQATGVQEVILIPTGCHWRHCGNLIKDEIHNSQAGITNEFRTQLAELLAKYE